MVRMLSYISIGQGSVPLDTGFDSTNTHTFLASGMSGKEEVSESVSQRRRAEEDGDGEEERESKRARTATEEEQAVDEVEGAEKMEEAEVEDEDEEKELDDEEGAEEEEEDNNQESTPTKQNDQQQSSRTGAWGDGTKPSKGGLKCILKCNFQVKQTGGLISVEAYYLGGSCGKDGLNQLVQYMRNQLSQPRA